MLTAKSKLVGGLACLVSIATGMGAAHAAPERQPVESVKPLLQVAYDRGQARGVLVGPAAEAIAKQFTSREPIEIDVDVVGPTASPQCKRLGVTTRQADVRDIERPKVVGGQAKLLPPKPMMFKYQVSFCANGSLAAPGTAKPVALKDKP